MLWNLLFFDTWDNGSNDPNDNHVELVPMPVLPQEQVIYTPTFDMDNTEWHHALMSYQDQALSVLLTPFGGNVETAFSAEPLPSIAGVGWWLRLGGLNQGEHRVDNVVLTLVAYDPFRRSDCNQDGSFDISDPIAQLNILFAGGSLECIDACDSDDDGQLDIIDPILLISTLFGIFPTPIVFGGCEQDPTFDSLDCQAFLSCP